jgi:hypothetical protein
MKKTRKKREKKEKNEKRKKKKKRKERKKKKAGTEKQLKRRLLRKNGENFLGKILSFQFSVLSFQLSALSFRGMLKKSLIDVNNFFRWGGVGFFGGKSEKKLNCIR